MDSDASYIRESACSSEIVSLYPVRDVYWKEKTAFAECIIAEVPGFGRTLFIDNEVQSAAEDEDIYHECLVHPVMAAASSRDRVLVVGGGEGATVREVLKWVCAEGGVGTVDWVDIDGELVKACKDHLGWAPSDVYDDPRVHYYAEDIRKFLDRTTTSYNVILIDLPDPDPEADVWAPAEAEGGCLMNVEFWRSIAAHLEQGGVWATHTGPVRRRGPSGATVLSRGAAAAGLSVGAHYHAVIRSFTDDWGFMMSVPPVPALPTSVAPLRFLMGTAYDCIFRWAWPVAALNESH
jgi:spermidine synthase